MPDDERFIDTQNVTVESIRKDVAEIASMAHDPEMAHTYQDALYEEVLEAIADGASQPEKLAQEALAASRLKFPRWMA